MHDPNLAQLQALDRLGWYHSMELPDGMRDDVLFLYDIETPADFTPRNTDGEIEDFRVLSARE